MPDLQSELSKIANAWDTHEQTIRHDSHDKHTQPKENAMQIEIQKTGNTSRDLFHYIHKNPYKYNAAQIIAHLTQLGYNKKSVSSLITQMKRSHMVTVSDSGHLCTTHMEYKPITNPYTSKKHYAAKKAKAKVTPASAGIAALPVAEEPARKQLMLKMTADDVLTKLDVKEAFKLYQELAQMFGG